GFPQESITLPVEVSNGNGNGGSFGEGEGSSPLADILASVAVTSQDAISVSDIWMSKSIDGMLYTVGGGPNLTDPTHAHEINLNTGESRSIELRSLPSTGGNRTFADDV